MMERGEQEPQPPVDLKILEGLREGQIVQFPTEGGFRLLTDTGVGVTEVYSPSLTELPSIDLSHPTHDTLVSTTVNKADFSDWAEGLATPQDIVEVAIRKVERREREGYEDVIQCPGCEGESTEPTICFCTLGRSSAGAVGETTETAGMSWVERAPDPNCSICDGSGEDPNKCSLCEGANRIMKYPHVVFRNGATGDEQMVTIDLAALIASGEVDITVGGYEREYPYAHRMAVRDVRFDLSRYIDTALARIGIDRANATVEGDNYVAELDSRQLKVASNPAYWQKHGGDVKYDGGTMTAAQILDDAQAKLRQAYAYPPRRIREQGVVVAGEWTMRPLPPMQDTLNNLRTVASENGYTLGLTRGPIGTNALGLRFFVTSPDGTSQWLSGDPAIRESLESAWRALQGLFAQAEDAPTS